MNDSNEHEDAQPKQPSNLGGLILIGIVAIVVLALRFGGGIPSSGQSHQLVGSRLGQLALKPLTADAAGLSADNLLGKVTLINFWGTWCGPCQAELPHLIQLHRRFRDNSDFQFVSVTIPQGPGTTEASLTKMSADRLSQLGAEFGFYADEGTLDHLAIISGEMMGMPIPTTLVVDRNGVIVGTWTGYSRGVERHMATTVSEALAAGE